MKNDYRVALLHRYVRTQRVKETLEEHSLIRIKNFFVNRYKISVHKVSKLLRLNA